MTEHEQERFDSLRAGPCVPAAYVQEYYGLPWPLPNEAGEDYAQWAGGLRRPAACGAGVSRYELETFLQQQKAAPKKWAAAELGMDEASLDRVLEALPRLGMRKQRYVMSGVLVTQPFADDLVANLPKMKYRTFGDHNSFCERLHAELADDYGVQITPLFCATADRMKDYPRQYARHFDCLTLMPLSVRHQVWLDFDKPLNLSPDRCSKLLYLEYQDELKPYCAGSGEPDLAAYETFMARA